MEKDKQNDIEERLHKYFQQIGKKGGAAAAKSMTAKERVKRAQKAAASRWQRARKEGKQ